MMSLVNYGSSDEDSSDDDPSVTQPVAIPAVKRSDATITSSNQPISLLSSITALGAKKKGGSSLIQISAPSLAELEDSSSDEDAPKKKKVKPSSSGSGLSSLLPRPSSYVQAGGSGSQTTTRSLVPDSVRRPKPALPPPKKAAVVTKLDDDDDLDTSNYFSISEDVVNRLEQEEELRPGPAINSAPKLSREPPVAFGAPIPESSAGSSQKTSWRNLDSNDLQLKKRIAAKFGEELPDQIHITDINVNDHIGFNRDYLKTISVEKPQEVQGEAPSSTAKRKHQITYLAHQAKQHELALKNEWAASKLNKNQTRAKYGF